MSIKDRDGNQILALYLRLSVLLLSVNTSAYELSLSLLRLARLGKFPKVHCAPLPNTVSLSLKQNGQFYTAIERFASQALNAGFLARLEKVLFASKITLAALETFLEQDITRARSWLLGLIACIIQCVATCRFFGGDWPACAGTAFATFTSFTAFHYFADKQLNLLLLEIIVAFIASMAALAMGTIWPSHTPLAMLFACIIWMVPGILMMNSFSDLLHGFIAAFLHNATKATMIIFALLLGLTPATLSLHDLSVDIAIAPTVDWFWAGLAALACAYRFEAMGKLLIASFFLGALGHGTRAFFVLQLGYNPLMATFVGAVMVGVAVAFLFYRNPLLIIYAATIGIIPLIPGAALLKSFHALLQVALQGQNITPAQLSMSLGMTAQATMEVLSLAIGGILPSTLLHYLRPSPHHHKRADAHE